MGSAARWREVDREFQSLLRTLGRQQPVLRPHLAQTGENESLSARLLAYFEAHGEFYVDEARGEPWLRLPLADGEEAATGVSRSGVMAGDPRLAVLILTAVIDYNLRQAEARRENIEHIDWALLLLRQASERAARR
jgi:hypothetical protein